MPAFNSVATVVITSKDRSEDLRKSLESCFLQEPVPEVIVVDDASTDGTSDMVRSQFPAVRVIRHDQSTGYIVGRNEAARVASGQFIFSIDDDAVFTTPHVIASVLETFRDPAVGAVAIPYVDVRQDTTTRQQAPTADELWVVDRYVGTAHAVRRDVFLNLGGYRECYFHQGEERDLCLRMLDRGYVVCLGRSDPIHHFESPRRDITRMDLFGRRNDLLFAWLNVPLFMLPAQLAGTSIKGIWFGIRVRRPLRMLRGLTKGFAAIFRFWSERAPVSSTTYRLFRRLQRSGPIALNALSCIGSFHSETGSTLQCEQETEAGSLRCKT